MAVKVLVNGVGAIGKRVAHAVRMQKDMQLAGVADAMPTGILRNMIDGPLKGTKLFASAPDFKEGLEKGGFKVEDTLENLLASKGVDVVADATPAKIDEKNKPLYQKYGVKHIYQGGAKASLADVSFNANMNYHEALGKQSARVVSCNTTSLARTIGAIENEIGVKRAIVSLVRRAVDPWNAKKGPINAIEPALPLPSHHGPDLNTIMPDLNIQTMAVVVPTTLAHVHMVAVDLEHRADLGQVKTIFKNTPRVINIRANDGYSDTARVIERFRDLLRPRYDMHEAAVWDESIAIKDGTLYWMHAVHSEAIVVPESIDAIRAITGIERDNMKSIKMTDKAMGIL